jgi:riboflavin synthase
MFTGIVREVGHAQSISGHRGGIRLVIDARATAAVTAVGDSVSIDGVCLTAVAVADGLLSFDAVPETLARTALGGLAAGARVNVEAALRAGDPLGGHYVQGHVDGVGVVSDVREDGFSRVVTVEADPAVLKYIVEKGSIAVDGVSLTVASVDDRGFQIALIPETQARTTLGEAAPGRRLNLEVDVLAKHVEKLLAGSR